MPECVKKNIMLLVFILLIACSQLFRPTSCPAVRKFNCGLAGQEKPETRRDKMTQYTDYRRKDMDIKHPWRIKNPEELKKLAPTPPSSRIYWNLTNERCDYMRLRCLKAYTTGAVCARTVYYYYLSFPSYCAMVFHNCIAAYDNIWFIAYMGYCVDIDMDKHLYVDMTYDQMSNNTKLKLMYVAGSDDKTDFKAYATIPSTLATNATTRRTTTPKIAYIKVTDKNGSAVTDGEGKYVTYTEIVPPVYATVTDADGNAMIEIDDEGDYVTVTDPPTTTTVETTTTAPVNVTITNETATTKKAGRYGDYY